MSFSRSKVTCVPTVNWIEKACQLPLKVKSIFCDERSVILTCYHKGAAHHRVVNSKTRDWECAALGETASFWEGVGGGGQTIYSCEEAALMVPWHSRKP